MMDSEVYGKKRDKKRSDFPDKVSENNRRYVVVSRCNDKIEQMQVSR